MQRTRIVSVLGFICAALIARPSFATFGRGGPHGNGNSFGGWSGGGHHNNPFDFQFENDDPDGHRWDHDGDDDNEYGNHSNDDDDQDYNGDWEPPPVDGKPDGIDFFGHYDWSDGNKDDDDDDHWGWIGPDHYGDHRWGGHYGWNDPLCSTKPVPLPGAVWLGVFGLGLVKWTKRRMTN